MQLPRTTPTGHRARPGLAAAVLTAAVAVTVVAAGAPAVAAPVDGPIRDAGTAEVVAGSYIVVLKPGSGDVSASARTLASRAAGTVTHTYGTALRGFAVRTTEAAAKRLAVDPGVEFVQRDGVHSISGSQSNPPSWGLDRIDQKNLPLNQTFNYPDSTRQVTAYVIDTGIRFSHREFGGRAVSGRDTVDNDNDATDCQGHGTHVSGTIGGSTFGVAKSVRLVGVRVLGCDGRGSTAQVVAGIDWAAADAAGRTAVANMSLGGGVAPALDAAVSNAIGRGLQFAIAAGNGDFLGRPQNACSTSPARVPAAITVGATQIDDQKASFSNFGTCLDVFAPGVNIVSAWFADDNASRAASGTSMASPHVAGVAALLLDANPGLTPEQLRNTLVERATSNVVGNPGAGSPNKLLFLGGGGGTDPPPGCSGTNGNDVAIPDNSTVSSTITVGACNRSASASATVEVHIRHTWRGDLVIDLVAPDGTAYRLKNSSANDSADDVNATFPVNLASEAANGGWQLRVQDVFAADTGVIDTWTLTV